MATPYLVLAIELQELGTCHQHLGCCSILYFFTQIKWPNKALVQLDRMTRKVLRCLKSHHYSASIKWLYLSRLSGGRGLVNIRQANEREVVASGLYLAGTVQDELLQAVVKHQLYWLTRPGKATFSRPQKSRHGTASGHT